MIAWSYVALCGPYIKVSSRVSMFMISVPSCIGVFMLVSLVQGLIAREKTLIMGKKQKN